MGLDRREDDNAVNDEKEAFRVGKPFKDIGSESTASLKIKKTIAEISQSLERNLDPQRPTDPIQDTFQFMAAKIYENRNTIGKASVTASKALPLAGGTMTGNVNFGDNDITNVDSLDADKFSIAGGTEMTGILDEDAMGTNSATQLATQQSIKAYVDARYSYQYISFFGSVSAANNNNGGPYYMFTSGNGISNHSWTKYNVGTALAITNDTIDLDDDSNCSPLNISTYLGANQIVIPQTSEIVGFYATNRSTSDGHHVGNAIFVIPEANVNWGDSTSMTAYLKYRSISSAHTGTTNNFSNSNINTSKVMMCHDMARGTYEVAAGSIIVPSIFCDTHSQGFASSMTIVIRTKI